MEEFPGWFHLSVGVLEEQASSRPIRRLVSKSLCFKDNPESLPTDVLNYQLVAEEVISLMVLNHKLVKRQQRNKEKRIYMLAKPSTIFIEYPEVK